MMKMDYTKGTWLRHDGRGIEQPIPIVDKLNHFVLGYDPNNASHNIRKPSLTLNGQFILQGDTKLY